MVLDSIDNILGAYAAGNGFNRLISFLGAGQSAANTTSGGVFVGRSPDPFIFPSVGGGLSGMYPTDISIILNSGLSGIVTFAIEYDLGSLTVSGNSFSSVGSVTMPVKTIRGSAIQTATLLPILQATSAITATTPVVTITYTDQDGNTGQTCTMTLPTNPTSSHGFLMTPHLANGDTGVRAVTNMSISTGSAGTFKVYGLLPLQTCYQLGSSPVSRVGVSPPLRQFLPSFMIEPGEALNLYNFDCASVVNAHVKLSGVAA